MSLFPWGGSDRKNHWRFIEDCAPPHLRSRLHRRLIWRCAYLVVSRTVLRHVALPLGWFRSEKPLALHRGLRPPSLTESTASALDLAMCVSRGQSDRLATCRSSPGVVLTGLYYVTKEDCVACGCDADLLRRMGVLKSWRRDDWYLLDKGFRSQIRDDRS